MYLPLIIHLFRYTFLESYLAFYFNLMEEIYSNFITSFQIFFLFVVKVILAYTINVFLQMNYHWGVAINFLFQENYYGH